MVVFLGANGSEARFRTVGAHHRLRLDSEKQHVPEIRHMKKYTILSVN